MEPTRTGLNFLHHWTKQFLGDPLRRAMVREDMHGCGSPIRSIAPLLWHLAALTWLRGAFQRPTLAVVRGCGFGHAEAFPWNINREFSISSTKSRAPTPRPKAAGPRHREADRRDAPRAHLGCAAHILDRWGCF